MSKTYTTTTTTTAIETSTVAAAAKPSTNNSFLEKLDSSFARLFIELESSDLMDTPLSSKCGTIYDGVLKVSAFAHEYNFSGINANGYWTFLKSCQKAADLLADKLSSTYDISEESLQSMDDLAEGYVRILNHIMAIREITKEDGNGSLIKDENCNTKSNRNTNISTLSTRSQAKNCKSLFVPSSLYSIDIARETLASQVQLTSIMTNYGTFWLCKSLKYFFEVYMLAVAFFGSSFPFSMKCLWSREHRIKAFVHWIQYPSLSFPFDIWDILDYKLVSKVIVPMLFMGRGVRAQTVNVPRQSKYRFTEDGKDVIRSNSYQTNVSPAENEYVKCRLIQGRSSAKTGKLLFHCHGGGWLTHSPESHENYLRQWAADVPDITIFSVAYSLKQHHPIALQEVLDAYLWVTSGKREVFEMLGFYPETIVFAGDSAGANLVVSLAMALSHIKSKYNCDITIPDGIVSIYGAFLLTPAAGPSRVIGYIDPLLSPGVLLTCGGVYGNMVDANSPAAATSECFLLIKLFAMTNSPQALRANNLTNAASATSLTLTVSVYN